MALAPYGPAPARGPGFSAGGPLLRAGLPAARHAALSCLLTLLSIPAGQAQQLPVPCVGCSPAAPAFVTSGVASYATSGTVGTITQQSERAILNWSSFNVAPGHAVEFRQPSATSAALNRIYQADPSRILGALTANGQVLLINQNGIVFGPGARVDARALTAATLNVADDIFNGVGLAGAINLGDNPQAAQAAFAGTSNPDAAIRVENGARLSASERILLVAPNIDNRGTIETPGGQAILAASRDTVYLASDRELRGLLVEVGTGGTIDNLGDIVAGRGNVTLAGLAVNQAGRIRATTSVSVNGSIRLLARDGANPATFTVSDGGARTPVATRAGTLTLERGSTTEVQPEVDSPDTGVDAQQQSVSLIEAMARTLELRADSRVLAPGGRVSFTATSRPDQPLGGGAADAQIHVGAGSVIDVSGDDSAIVPMERNQASLRLFGNELADAPLQRTGPLARQEITVDLRSGTPLTDISRLREDVRRTVGERLAPGGTVALAAEGDVILQPGSVVDFSGGRITYADGFLSPTQLVAADGRIVDISRADPALPYAGILGRTEVRYSKWGVVETFPSLATANFERGYTEGKDAGSLDIQAAGVYLGGTLQGASIAGRLQREAPAAAGGTGRSFSELPLAGRLSIAKGAASALPGFASVLFATTTPTDSFAFGSRLPASLPLRISSAQLRGAGIGRLELIAPGLAWLPRDVELELAPGGELNMRANRLLLEGAIRSTSGTVQLTATASGMLPGAIEVGESATIDVRGGWVNDAAAIALGRAPSAPLFLDGGSVQFDSQGDLRLATGSSIDVSAGAQLQAAGDLRFGAAGSIALASRIPAQTTLTTLEIGAQLRAFGFAEGGALRLAAAAVRLTDQPAPARPVAGELRLAPEFFAAGGFGSYDLGADRGSFEIDDDVRILFSPLSQRLAEGFRFAATGADLRGFTTFERLPAAARAPTSFAGRLVRTAGVDGTAVLRVGDGARLETEPGGSLSFSSDSELYVGGSLRAPGGSIVLGLGTPASANDRGFDPSQALRLGAASALDVAGVSQVLTDDLGRRSGRLLDGGSVSLVATRGYVAASQGSVIDVSGSSETFDRPGAQDGRLEPTRIASPAGRISVRAAEGALLFGSLLGRAGGPGAAGGVLAVTIDATSRDPNEIVTNPVLPQFPESRREIVVGGNFTGDFVPGVPVPALLNGMGFVDDRQVRAGGFDVVDLTVLPVLRFGVPLAPGAVRFEPGADLTAGRRIALDAPLLLSTDGAARVRAPLVSLGPSDTLYRTTAVPQAGTGRLAIEADHLDIRGNVVFSGLAVGGASPALDLSSRGDLRLIGTRFGGEPTRTYQGSLTTLADLRVAASQIYPTTLTEFSLTAQGDAARIVVAGGGAAGAPLAAAGLLRLSASEIQQGGVLRAPLGTLELLAATRLDLLPGSVTSTSAAGAIIPFGITEFGETWIYPLGDVTRVIDSTPEKRVLLRAPEVQLSAGSRVDLGGGGDLLAYEFVRGPGGSRDVLVSDNPQGSFAIVPTRRDLFGVFDPLLSPAAALETGSTILLAGGGGIPGGEYARLPARYALLPGAFLLTPVAGYDDIQPAAAGLLPDGVTPVVAGRLGFAGTTTRDALWSGYAVLDGTQVRSRAEYTERLASDFFVSPAATRPADAGTLTIDASRAIRLDGTLAAGTTSGRGARIDFVAENLALVAARSASPGRVELLASELRNLGAASLLLGATRRAADDDEVELDVRARTVTIEAGTAIEAPEILLAATDAVTVASAATLRASGTAVAGGAAPLRLVGDGAFVRLSAGVQAEVTRSNETGAAGRLLVQQGATLSAAGSISLDASADMLLRGSLQTDAGALSLATSSISFGAAPQDTRGLVLGEADLARFGARELRFASRGTIDFYGDVSATRSRLELDAAGLRGFDPGAPSVVTLRADELQLGNSRGNAAAVAGTGRGTLSLSAETLTLAGGAFDLSGFADSRLVATRGLRADADTRLATAGSLAIATPRLSAGAGVDVALSSRDALSTTLLAAPAGSAVVDALGARFSLAASSVRHGSRLELPSGAVSIQASGPGGIELLEGSSIDVSGRVLDFRDVRVGSPGGTVSLLAAQGGVGIASGATIDVSAPEVDADAGRLGIAADAGEVRFGDAVRLLGTAGSGSSSGAIDVVARSLGSGFAAWNRALNAGGFGERRSLAVATGDIVIAAGETVRAREVTLATDGGSILVAGAIDASGERGGRVRLAARDDVTVAGTARVAAGAAAPGEQGGSIELASRSGRLRLQADGGAAGALLRVGGTDLAGSPAADGFVRLRAPRLGAGGVAIDPPAGAIAGAGRIDLEAFRVYAADTIDAPLIAAIGADTDAFMIDADAILGALGVAADPAVRLVPGVQVESAGDLALAGAWDLLQWRYGGAPGVLTLRAGRDLLLRQSLSDGFAFQSVGDLLPERDVVQTGPSWSYRLVAGARPQGADPLGAASGAGAVTIDAGVFVRTGTGDIDVVAGSDVVLRSANSALYTAGENRGTGALDTVDAEVLLRGDFVANGGDIRIAAGGDVRGVSDRPLPDWLPRVAGEFEFYKPDFVFPAAWALDASKFQQGIGALGGGRIDIRAGGDLASLTVAVPTTGRPNRLDGTDTEVAGGGSIDIAVGGDIRGGVLHLGRGAARIVSGGGILQGMDALNAFPILQLGDARMSLWSRTGASIETAFSPTTAQPDPTQGLQDFFFFPLDSYFFDYSPRSAVELGATSGDVTLLARGTGIARAYTDRQIDPGVLTVMPGSLTARSLQGDVLVGSRLNLFPAPAGSLQLLAGRDVTSAGSGFISMSDADRSLLPGVVNPTGVLNEVLLLRLLSTRAPLPVHARDDVPALIVARGGDVGSSGLATLGFDIPKQTRLFASGDVRNLTLSVQHARPGDATIIEAGRDIVYAANRRPDGSLSENSNFIDVAGPGRVDLLAGRDVDFGSAVGIQTRGDLSNPGLADDGADINIWTGGATRPDFAAFVTRYLDGPTRYREQLDAYLARYVVDPLLSAVDNFRALPAAEQRPFIGQVFFDQLKEGGLADFVAGFDAIDVLFPNPADDDARFGGDLRSFLSRITTLDGGNISMFVPGGLVNAGVASSGSVTRRPDQVGIVAQRLGDVSAFVRADFLVNASRVFSLDGGNILVWSSEADIDAGRGARSALAIPPPTVSFDALGNVVIEFPPAISGSGIRTAVTTPGREPGDVFLFAPVGVVDAGDAGIASAGNVTIAATEVLGADNIDVGGVSVGVPTDTGGLGAGLAGVSATSASATTSATLPEESGDAAESAAPLAESALGWLEVFVLGFGEDNCAADDAECLRRQRNTE